MYVFVLTMSIEQSPPDNSPRKVYCSNLRQLSATVRGLLAIDFVMCLCSYDSYMFYSALHMTMTMMMTNRSDISVTETKTNTDMIAFSITYTETKTIKISNTNTT